MLEEEEEEAVVPAYQQHDMSWYNADIQQLRHGRGNMDVVFPIHQQERQRSSQSTSSPLSSLLGSWCGASVRSSSSSSSTVLIQQEEAVEGAKRRDSYNKITMRTRTRSSIFVISITVPIIVIVSSCLSLVVVVDSYVPNNKRLNKKDTVRRFRETTRRFHSSSSASWRRGRTTTTSTTRQRFSFVDDFLAPVENSRSRYQGFRNKDTMIASSPFSRRHHNAWCGGLSSISNTCCAATSLTTADGGMGGGFVEAQDLEALQDLFTRYCDKEGLMTKDNLAKIPAIAELLVDGELLSSEFDEIWDKAPKFPDVVTIGETSSEERIDVDSFVQVYRDIDDMFEDDDDDDVQLGQDISIMKEKAENIMIMKKNGVPAKNDPTTKKNGITISSTTNNSPKSLIKDDTKNKNVIYVDEDEDESDDSKTFEAELEEIYETMCDSNGRLGREQLLAWEEIRKLLDDGLVSMDEFDDIWSKTKKSPTGGGSSAEELLDVDGFLSFNVALDGLFELDDDDEEEEEEEPEPVGVVPAAGQEEDASREPTSVTSRDDTEVSAPPGLFQMLANKDGLVGQEELRNWDELSDYLEDGDLLESELTSLYQQALTSSSSTTMLDESAFLILNKKIDDLFEDDDDEYDVGDDDADNTVSDVVAVVEETGDIMDEESEDIKEQLMEAIDLLNSDEELLPCGLESTELDQREIRSLVDSLEGEPSNLIRLRSRAIEPIDLAGTWELLYSSSPAMRFNKGLSGLGGSVPSGRFGGLKQKLIANKYLTDVEYTERVIVKPAVASFDVKITGSWELSQSVSLFTGEPSLVLTVVPDMVRYGPTSTRADHWKSLGPMNLLDVTYLDDDLRVMRGSTTSETIFIFRRLSR